MPRARNVPPLIPDPTPEYIALEPRPGEPPLDALARVGDTIVQASGGDDTKDSRPNKKLPRQLAALVALRAQGFDNTEIADKLKVSSQKLRALVAKARREYGWSDLNDKLVNVALPLAVDNAIKHLQHEGSTLSVIRGTNAMTRTTLAGLGVFKTHAAVKSESKSEQTNILRVEISLPELPSGVQGSPLTDGSVLATPRHALVNPAIPALAASDVIDGEVVKVAHA